MSGVIATVMAALLGAASVLGTVDCSGIIQEAENRMQLAQEQEEASEFMIVIDAGHQGQANLGQEPIGPGASTTKNKVAAGTKGTTTGVPEYELTLDVSLKLRDALEEKGYKVLMIREDHDVNITNSERALMANEADADVFIRIHANGSESSAANGAMTICQTSSNPYNSEFYEDSKRLSELVLDSYTEATGIRSERVWETDTMSGINWCEVPVTILELGYMTNPEEDIKMQDPEFQDIMVEGIVDGIENYIEEKKEEMPQEVSAGSTEGAAAQEEPEESSDTEISEESSEMDSSEEVSDDAEAASTASTALSAETAPEIEPSEPKISEEKQKLADSLMEAAITPAYALAFTAYTTDQAITDVGETLIAQYNKEKDAKMAALEEHLREEIESLRGNWSLYFKRLDTGRVIGINADEQMIAASLIKFFVAGEFYRQTENGTLDESQYGNYPDIMMNISDNYACNVLIDAVGMENVNTFAKDNGYQETELNRKMLEFNGLENYTSARECGVVLEKVLDGNFVSKHASERILEKGLKEQQKRSKIPAGVPEGIQTANKTGELPTVDNDAAIIWSPACTYILCIMSNNTDGRIPEIVKLSSMIYDGINN